MIHVRSVVELRRHLAARRADGRVGFVPTMGALHAGHVELFHVARRQSAVVIASIFVNPTQFNDPRDLAAYPRTEEQDARLAAEAGVDLLFSPAAEEVYRPDDATRVHVEGAALGHEGEHRPGHFDGVATVCLKLFSMVEADEVYLGQKDAQQVAVLQQMVADFSLRMDVRVVPTVRDVDGVALSSRNARLSPHERALARAIPEALAAGLDAHRAKGDPRLAARNVLASLAVEYCDVVRLSGQPTLVLAVRVGATRLIDNVPLDRPDLAGLGMITAT